MKFQSENPNPRDQELQHHYDQLLSQEDEHKHRKVPRHPEEKDQHGRKPQVNEEKLNNQKKNESFKHKALRFLFNEQKRESQRRNLRNQFTLSRTLTPPQQRRPQPQSHSESREQNYVWQTRHQYQKQQQQQQQQHDQSLRLDFKSRCKQFFALKENNGNCNRNEVVTTRDGAYQKKKSGAFLSIGKGRFLLWLLPLLYSTYIFIQFLMILSSKRPTISKKYITNLNFQPPKFESTPRKSVSLEDQRAEELTPCHEASFMIDRNVKSFVLLPEPFHSLDCPLIMSLWALQEHCQQRQTTELKTEFSIQQTIPFPRWDFSSSPTANTTLIDSILDLVEHQNRSFIPLQPDNHPPDNYKTDYKLWVRTSDHTLQKRVVGWWQPEILYIVESFTNLSTRTTPSIRLYSSSFARELADHTTGAIKFKMGPTEELFHRAFQQFLVFNNIDATNNISTNLTIGSKKTPTMTAASLAKMYWPRLHRLLVEEKSSFPFYAHYSDYTGCNLNNWNNGTQSVPLFTVAASVLCNHTFPYPNYRLYTRSKSSPVEWDKLFQVNYQPPYYSLWMDKHPQVIWRGSLSGAMSMNITTRAPRWRLLHYIHSSQSSLKMTEADRQMFDVRMTHIPLNNVKLPFVNVTDLGGIATQVKMIDFQKYRAILDIDGHSWSGRFTDILCSSSVVVKVAPDFVDYFYYGTPNYNRFHLQQQHNRRNRQNGGDDEDDDDLLLLPWKHFIPVKNDLSDLVAKVKYAVDGRNHEHIQRIIYSANRWCKRHLIHKELALDTLDIFDEYLGVLDRSEALLVSKSSKNTGTTNTTPFSSVSKWKGQWERAKKSILQCDALQMVPLPTPIFGVHGLSS